MVSRTADSQKGDDIKYYGWQVYTLTMSQNDTFTASEFVDTENLKVAQLNLNSDGTSATATILNNVITCTQAITSKECTLYVFGVKA